MNVIKTLPAHSDSRGEITDLIEGETINAITVITFRQGAVRANHYHKHTTQWNYVISGVIRLVTQLPGKAVRETIMRPGDLVATVPDERHALQALEESTLMVFTKGPRGGKEYESDTYRLDAPLIA
jgi:quercetin dioxygenase-like cupin family protein